MSQALALGAKAEKSLPLLDLLRINTVLGTVRHISAASSTGGLHGDFTFLLNNVARLCPDVSLPKGTFASTLIKLMKIARSSGIAAEVSYFFVDLHAYCASQEYPE